MHILSVTDRQCNQIITPTLYHCYSYLIEAQRTHVRCPRIILPLQHETGVVRTPVPNIHVSG